MPTIGLCMIVKNEATNIIRCLDSVRPLIDYVCINDTGSTDGTQRIIKDWLDQNNIPGEVFDTQWVNFGRARQTALDRLRTTDIDYALTPDADDSLFYDPGFDPAKFKAGMAADHYVVKCNRIEFGADLICQ